MAKLIERESREPTLEVAASELPLRVEVVGNSGDRISYDLKRAGKRLGACLGKSER